MTRSRALATWWLALLSALAVLGLAVPAQAAPSEASHWTATRGGPRPTEVSSISCSDAQHCTAVSSVGGVLEYDGHTWGKTRTADHDLAELTSVSCPARSFCAAVGPTVATVEKHGHWRHVKVTTAGLFSVSCVSARWCLAVGSHHRTLRYDGSHWRAGPSAPSGLAALSCMSPTFCMAAIYDRRNTRVLRFNGHGWARAGSHSLLSRMSFYPGEGSLSCASRTLCLAASANRTARWNGHRWVSHRLNIRESAMASCSAGFCGVVTPDHATVWDGHWGRLVDLPGSGARPGTTPVSCPSRGRCVAVGTLTSKTVVLRGGSWRLSSFPASAPAIRQLSCPTSTFCMGLLEATDNQDTQARMLRDGVWTSAPLPAGWPGTLRVVCTSPSFCLAAAVGDRTALWDGTSWSEGQAIELGAVDCVSSTYCVAVTHRHTSIWNGTAWSEGPGATANVFNISCGGVGDCWGGTSNAVTHFDGSAWSARQVIAFHSRIVTTSCTPSTCFASDTYGNILQHQGTDWVLAQKHLGPLAGLDCATSTCTAVPAGRLQGRVARWNGTSWSRSRLMPPGYNNLPKAVSCPTDSTCLVVDQGNTAWIRR